MYSNCKRYRGEQGKSGVLMSQRVFAGQDCAPSLGILLPAYFNSQLLSPTKS
jgi:hypothetical protein